MKHTFLFLVIVILASGACKEKKQENHDHASSAEKPPADTLKKSIPKEEHAQIGKAHITIKYHAPAVRDRVIWGGLVPYDQVWVTGAHSATSFEIDQNFIVDNKTIQPGKYAIFTIPGKENWTVIFNKNWEQHLTDEYDPKDDGVRFTVAMKETNETQERLYYAIKKMNDSEGILTIRWEKIEVSIPFSIPQ